MKILKAFERRTRQIGTEIEQQQKTKQPRTERVIQKKLDTPVVLFRKKLKKLSMSFSRHGQLHAIPVIIIMR